MIINVTIPIKAVPKERPRLGIRAYTPTRTKDFERLFAHHLRLAYPKLLPTDAPVSVFVSCQFAVKKPTGLPRGDVDNMAKAVMDAMNGIVYVDDRQVMQVTCAKKHGDVDSITLRVLSW